MKEHLPIFFIAVFGLCGLFHLHQEENIQNKSISLYNFSKFHPRHIDQQSEKISLTYVEEDLVIIELSNLSDEQKYWLQFEDGRSHRVYKSMISHKLEKGADLKLKLFKEDDVDREFIHSLICKSDSIAGVTSFKAADL